MITFLMMHWYLISVAQSELIIRSGSTIQFDGIFDQEEWRDADSVSISILNNTKQIQVRYKHDSSSLQFSYRGSLESSNVRFPEILLDMNNSKSSQWESDDWWFHVSASDCEYQGQYGNYQNCAVQKSSWTASPNITPGNPKTDYVEIIIPFELIGLDTMSVKKFGVCFLVTNTSTAFEYYPLGALRLNPNSWATAQLLGSQALGLGLEIEPLNIFPNPFDETLTLSGMKDVQQISISDALGQQLYFVEQPSQQTMEFKFLSSGMYIICCTLKSGRVLRKKVQKI